MATDVNAHLRVLPWKVVLSSGLTSTILADDKLDEAVKDLNFEAITPGSVLPQAAAESRLLALDHLAKARRHLDQAKTCLYAASGSVEAETSPA